MDGLSGINDYLHEHIPITGPMGIAVTGYDGRSVTLSAPLSANLNHRRTAFGGSVSTLGILAGWVLLHLRLRDREPVPRLVIQHSETDFLEPIQADFLAVCRMRGTAAWERFERTLNRAGRARLALEADIIADGRSAGRHRGEYVAIA